ncbi:glycosyltransferase family 4 protein [Shewanella oncorhynchi]|uniref:glycosyltransferase family 4 protein n=1 Tax=Shewanella oncorhynchi TaxID=2726434 RepID=UPI003D7B2ADC
MKVLLCSNEFDDSSQPPTGGIGVFNRIYITHLNNSGLCSMDYFGLSISECKKVNKGYKVNFFKPMFYFKTLNKVVDNSSRFILLLPFLFIIDMLNRIQFTYAIKRYILENDIDMVECSDYKGISSLFSLFKIDSYTKVVIRTHGTNTVLSKCDVQKSNVIAKFHERLSSLCKNYIYISTSAKVAYENSFGEKSNSIVCFNGVNTSINNDKLKHKLANCNSEVKVLNFGTQSVAKGIEIIDDLSRFHVQDESFRVRFFLAGKLTCEASEIIKGNKNICYLGILNQDELFEFLDEVDLCLFPSKFENCPMSWIESMARGIPVIVSSIPVSEEIVDNDVNGKICKSIEEYKDAIIKLCNKDLREQLSIQATKKARECFSIDEMCKKSIKFYDSIILL